MLCIPLGPKSQEVDGIPHFITEAAPVTRLLTQWLHLLQTCMTQVMSNVNSPNENKLWCKELYAWYTLTDRTR